MVWAKLDDEILDNPKIVRAGVFGFALHIAGIAWCSRNLTDGVIPTARVRSLLMLDRVSFDNANPLALIDGPSSSAGNEGLDALTVADHLVDCGLWVRVSGGYEINDYLVYNPSRAEVEAKRSKETQRARDKRSSRPPASASRPTVASMLPATREQPGADLERSLSSPDPDPDPVPKENQIESAFAPNPPSSGTKVSRRKPETACPESAATGQEVVTWAASMNIPDGHPEFGQFLDHHRAKQSRFADWGAAWRTWTRNAEKFAARAGPRGHHVQPAVNRAWRLPEGVE
jgi:hypothetical protein